MKTIETLVFPFKHFSLTKKTTGTKRQAKCLIKLKEKNTSTPEKVHRKKVTMRCHRDVSSPKHVKVYNNYMKFCTDLIAICVIPHRR